MLITRNQPAPALVLAASTRDGSVNRALADRIAAHLAADLPVEVIDLRDHPMPLYDRAVEERDGVPAAAVALAGRFAAAGALVVVTPEYNGAFTPLLKNTVDWVTRVDIAALAHLRVLVASASPGRGGGSAGAALTRLWLSNMGIDVADRSVCVGGASLAVDGSITGVDDADLARFAAQALDRASAA